MKIANESFYGTTAPLIRSHCWGFEIALRHRCTW